MLTGTGMGATYQKSQATVGLVKPGRSMAALSSLGLTEFAGLVITQSQTTSNHCLKWIVLFNGM